MEHLSISGSAKAFILNLNMCAFKAFEEVREHYLDDLKYMLDHDMYVGIATHDKFLVDNAIAIIKEKNIDKTKFEFQMLYGVTPELRNSILKQGYKMRVYVPFGKRLVWLFHSPVERKSKEWPHHIVKALFFRG